MAWCGTGETVAAAADRDVTGGPGVTSGDAGGLPGIEEKRAATIIRLLALYFASAVEWIVAYAARNPKKAYAFGILVVLGAAVAPHQARAIGMLDQMQADVISFGSAGIDNSINNIAVPLFLVLAGLTISYNLVVYAGTYDSIKGFFQKYGIMFLNLFLPFVFIKAIPSVVDALPGIGQSWATSINGQNNLPNSISGVAERGTGIAWGLLTKVWQAVFASSTPTTGTQNGGGNWWTTVTGAVSNAGTLLTPTGLMDTAVHAVVIFIAFCVSCIILICFAMIAVEILMAYIQFYITMPAAAWTLGFHGSPATQGQATAYWGAVIKSLIRFIVIIGIATWMVNTTQAWSADIAAQAFKPTSGAITANGAFNAAASTDIGVMKFMIGYLISSIVLAAVVRQAPSIADVAMTGGVALGGAGLVLAAKAGVTQLQGEMIQSMSGGGGNQGRGGGGPLGVLGTAQAGGAKLLDKLFESGGR